MFVFSRSSSSLVRAVKRVMTLLLRNLQKVVPVNVPKLKQDVTWLRRIMHIERFDVSLLCVDDDKIQELNKMYRGVDEVTDVLSFPAHEVSLQFIGA